MGYLGGFVVTARQHRLFGGKQVTTEYSGGREKREGQDGARTPRSPSPSGCTVATSSTATRTAWRSASAASCAPACVPAKCIYVRGADNPVDDPVSPGERYGFVYEINYLRCIHCDLCVEACPTEAITESKLFEFSFTNRRDAIYTKAELLVGDDGKPKQLPWEDWREGDDVLTSGWMRATAPAAANFEGRRRRGPASSATASAEPEAGPRPGESRPRGRGGWSSSSSSSSPP